MGKRRGVESSIAMADAVAMCDVDAIAAYPITPQTHIVEHLSELVYNGELDAEFVPVESEHSAMSACCGMSAAGARTFTATSSQGLLLMNEIVHIVPAMRLPVVMAVANRAISAPISIWNDHGDLASVRDTGWLQIVAENGQECFDMMPLAFRVAEDKRVHLPIMVHFDGFIVSHMIEAIAYWEPEQVKEFLPPFEPQIRLDIHNPVAMGIVGVPEIYYETRLAQHQALLDSLKVIKEAFDDLERIVGRRYNVVETYNMDKAEIALVMMGSLSETAMSAVKAMKEKGIEVGIIRPRVWRPFPTEDFLAAVKNVKALGLVDRAFTFGGHSHPLATEIKSVLYGSPVQPKIAEFTLGIGGRDVKVEDIVGMYGSLVDMLEGKDVPRIQYVGVRE